MVASGGFGWGDGVFGFILVVWLALGFGGSLCLMFDCGFLRCLLGFLLGFGLVLGSLGFVVSCGVV